MRIEHIAKSHVRKEAVVARVLAERGDDPGLVHILSAMEACDSHRPVTATVPVVWTGSGKNKLRAGRRLKVAPFPESKSILDVVAVL